MNKRLTALLLTCVLSLSLLAGCGSTPAKPAAAPVKDLKVTYVEK